MKKTLLTTAVLTAAGIFSASAQDNLVVSGRIINAPFFDPSHIMLFSQNDYVYGTSRSASMGGAFTSLGADLSSMNINPAGLGMYQSSDWGITQALSIFRSDIGSTVVDPANFSSGGTRVSYGLNNVAAAFNLFNHSSGLTSMTIGFGYNRVANFNSRSNIRTTNEEISIGDMFYHQLNWLGSQGVSRDHIDTGANPFDNLNIPLDTWGAILGYQTGLAFWDAAAGDYRLSIEPNAVIDSYMKSVTRGGMYEYTFSAGANIDNILYLGATIGTTQIDYRETLTYEEGYANNGLYGSNMWFDQVTRISGYGFTMKLGAIARPIPELRIGAAFHLPNYFNVEKSYTGEMSFSSRTRDTGALVDNQRFRTAPRLLAGVSYIIGDRAIVSLDYERIWYNSARLRSNNTREATESKELSKRLYKPGNTFRIGAEFLATPRLSVRAGGGYQMSFLNDETMFLDVPISLPMEHTGFNVTGGVGFKLGQNGYLDLAYIFKRSKYVGYEFFYFEGNGTVVSQIDRENGGEYARRYMPRSSNHMITLTLGSRF